MKSFVEDLFWNCGGKIQNSLIFKSQTLFFSAEKKKTRLKRMFPLLLVYQSKVESFMFVLNLLEYKIQVFLGNDLIQDLFFYPVSLT